MKKFFTLIFIFTVSYLSAQTYKVEGSLEDNEKKPVEAAMVVVLNVKDSTMLGYAMSDAQGNFKIGDLPKGDANLQITFIGYGTIQKLIKIEGDQKLISLGKITMREDAQLLQGVTVTAEFVPIRVTKDTVEYNADAFKVQPNANVEELLKKLPGVEVSPEGNISIKGEEVKAVTVDGKDFFGKNPQMATKNLPADAVKKVQFFDKKSKNAEFTGVDDGNEEKTLNLELKENKKNGSFGNIMAGHDLTDRYESKLTFNRFSKKTQYSIIGNANNLNMAGLNAQDFMSAGGGFNSGAPLNWGNSGVGNQYSATVGLNYNYTFTKNSKLNASYYFQNSGNELKESMNRSTFLRDRTLVNDRSSLSNRKANSHNVNLSSDVRIDSMSEFSVSTTVTYRENSDIVDLIDSTSSEIGQLINYNDQSKDNSNKSTNFSGNASFRRKLNKKGRNIAFQGAYGQNLSQTFNTLLSSLYDANGAANLQNSVYQLQDNNTGADNYNVGITYNEPLGKKWTWSTEISTRNNRTDLAKDFFDLDPNNTTVSTLNTELSRAFDNSFQYSYLGQTFRYYTEKYSLNLGAQYQYSYLSGEPSIGIPIRRPFQYILPNASLEFEKPGIRLNYNTNVREPSIDQLQPIVDNSDPLNLYIGNPDLAPEYRHNFRLSYNKFDEFNFRSFFANIRYTYTDNKIINTTDVNELNIRSRKPVNVDYESGINGFFSYSSPLNFMKSKVALNGNTGLTQGITFLNNQPTTFANLNNGIGITLENKSKKTFDISGRAQWSFNNNIYKSNEAANTEFVNTTYTGNFVLYPGKGWTLDTRFERMQYGQGTFDEETSVNLWSASVSKVFFKNKWMLKLRAFDLLNQNQGINRSSSDIAVTETISNTIGRYFMLSATYDLKSMGSAPKGGGTMIMRH
jgi:hypothetical protein